jgi:dimethylglycine dehydrogenase
MTHRELDVGLAPAHVLRVFVTGELGFEIYVAPPFLRPLYDRICAAGLPLGLRPMGNYALNSLRLEKSSGTGCASFLATTHP